MNIIGQAKIITVNMTRLSQIKFNQIWQLNTILLIILLEPINLKHIIRTATNMKIFPLNRYLILRIIHNRNSSQVKNNLNRMWNRQLQISNKQNFKRLNSNKKRYYQSITCLFMLINNNQKLLISQMKLIYKH